MNKDRKEELLSLRAEIKDHFDKMTEERKKEDSNLNIAYQYAMFSRVIGNDVIDPQIVIDHLENKIKEMDKELGI